MPKGSPELIAARREEIMNACEQLYQSMHFKDITLKEIGQATSFTRTSIYNYFQSKEEIFLALFEREYRLWTDTLTAIANSDEVLDSQQLAARIAASLGERTLLLRLLSVNLYDMEENSRLECLVRFKQTYGASVQGMLQILAKHCPSLDERKRRETQLTVFEFMHGIYPYAFATPKQIEAMKRAGVPYERQSVEAIARIGLEKLLSV